RRRHTRSKRDWSSDVCSSDLIWGSRWVGLEHFERFFDSYYFWRLLRNTLLLSLYQLLLFPLPIILALALNEVKNHVFKRFTQTRSEERRVGKECRSRECTAQA